MSDEFADQVIAYARRMLAERCWRQLAKNLTPKPDCISEKEVDAIRTCINLGRKSRIRLRIYYEGLPTQCVLPAGV